VFFEDVEVGASRQLGSYTMSREEILAFGRQFDPQPFHTDEEAARRTPYGGLIASGWHTAAVSMRLMVDGLLADGSGSLGSPGVDELRWLLPVRPGDTLSVATEVLEKKPSRSRPDRGSVLLRIRVANQRAEEVMTMVARGILRRR